MVANQLSIGELLDLPAEDDLYMDTYVAGSEPESEVYRSDARRAHRVDPSVLDPYLPEIRAGASDIAIAKCTSVKPSQVGRWRREQGVMHRRGRPSHSEFATTIAVELMGHPFDPVLTEVRNSIVGGRFEPPQFVLRDGLDYELFVQCVKALTLVGFADEQISLGFGVREQDIETARVLASRAA